MSVVLQMMELLCATARLVSPAEHWRVNDDFLPEGIVSGADCVKHTFAICISVMK